MANMLVFIILEKIYNKYKTANHWRLAVLLVCYAWHKTCLLYTSSLIKNANNEVLSNHLNHCVKHAINEHDADKKIDEVIKLLTKL